jgi:hypothetical protein
MNTATIANIIGIKTFTNNDFVFICLFFTIQKQRAFDKVKVRHGSFFIITKAITIGYDFTITDE